MPSSTRGMGGESSGWTSSPSTARPSPPEKGGTHRVRRLPQEERHQGPRRRNSCLSSGQRDDREGERARVKEAHPSDGRRGGEGTPPEGQAQEEALSGPRGQELRHIPRQAVPPEEAHPCEHTKEEQEEASGETDDFRQACPEEDALHRGTVLQLDEIVQEDRHEVRQACLLVHGVHPHRLQPHPHEGGIEIGSFQERVKSRESAARQMNFKEFWRSGRKVSEVGMGTYYDPLWIATATPGWRRDATQKVEAIKAGLDAGMTLIDTAEIYGSEPLVAKAIEGRKREDLFIATKVWPNHLRRDAVAKALRQSLQRLRLDYVDLYQIHWPNPSVPITETMGAMEELLAQGKIMSVGVSNFSLQQLVEANAALRKSRLASNQMSYSLLDRSIERSILPYCEREGIAIVAYYPLAHGRLASGERRLEEFARKRSKTPSQVALNWLTSKANVFPIPRASDPAHVLEDTGASGWRSSEVEIAELERLFPVR